jgi:hypothetical protein
MLSNLFLLETFIGKIHLHFVWMPFVLFQDVHDTRSGHTAFCSQPSCAFWEPPCKPCQHYVGCAFMANVLGRLLDWSATLPGFLNFSLGLAAVS